RTSWIRWSIPAQNSCLSPWRWSRTNRESRRKRHERTTNGRKCARRILVLVEAPNLLVMNGRKVAHAGEKSENPEVELQPEQIQALLDGDRARFLDRARALQDAAMMALKAADTKDKDALFPACERLDRACEECHHHYWYPNDKRAAEAAGEN